MVLFIEINWYNSDPILNVAFKDLVFLSINILSKNIYATI